MAANRSQTARTYRPPHARGNRRRSPSTTSAISPQNAVPNNSSLNNLSEEDPPENSPTENARENAQILTPQHQTILKHVSVASEKVVMFMFPFFASHGQAHDRETLVLQEAALLAKITIVAPPPGHLIYTKLRSRLTNGRTHLLDHAKREVSKEFKDLNADDAMNYFDFLIDEDRYTCPKDQELRKECVGRFGSEAFIEIVWNRYFEGDRSRGYIIPGFVELINGIFICLVATVYHHALMAWEDGVKSRVPNFTEGSAKEVFERHIATWDGLGAEHQQDILDYFRAVINKRLRSRKPGKRRESSIALIDQNPARARSYFQELTAKANQCNAVGDAPRRNSANAVQINVVANENDEHDALPAHSEVERESTD
jgi:hypothetical protein